MRKYRSPDCAGAATATLHLSGRWMPFGPRSARCRNVHGHWTLRNLRTGMRATLVLARSRDRTRVSRHGQRPGCSCAPGWKAGFMVTDDGRRRGGDRRGRGPSSPGGSEDAGAHSLPQLNRPGEVHVLQHFNHHSSSVRHCIRQPFRQPVGRPSDSPPPGEGARVLSSDPSGPAPLPSDGPTIGVALSLTPFASPGGPR